MNLLKASAGTESLNAVVPTLPVLSADEVASFASSVRVIKESEI